MAFGEGMGANLPVKPEAEITPAGKHKECMGSGAFENYAMVYTEGEGGEVTIEITAPAGKDGSVYTYDPDEKSNAEKLYNKISRVLSGADPVESPESQGDIKQVEHSPMQ